MSERQKNHEHYPGQASRRAERTGLLTTLVLATFDLGLFGSPESAGSRPAKASRAPEVAQPLAEVVPVRPRRQRRLATLAAKHAELGYADAA